MASTRNPKLPFFSRAYGGYTNAQEKYIREIVGAPDKKRILDPMAGQGFALSQFAWEGAHVQLGDTNPATLLMASLRDPNLITNRHELVAWLEGIISALARKRRGEPRTTIVPGWIAPSIAKDLDEYATRVGLGLFSNPFELGSDFWSLDIHARFGAAIAILAAREIACYRTTDNVTWLKPGGILRNKRIIDALRASLARWCEFADQVDNKHGLAQRSMGSVTTELMNVQKGQLGDAKKVNWIITSPPYANRLDYTRMWAPEIHVLAAMCSADVESLKRKQVGTTVVEGIDNSNREKELPRFMRKALHDIRSDPTEYSEVYYYPFFRNYAVSLMDGLKSMADRLRVNGTILVFVRDTVRKDVLFETGKLVTSVLKSKECGLVKIDSEKRIIRSHIGYVRKASASGLYGLAQQEWWLAFQKPSRSGGNGSST